MKRTFISLLAALTVTILSAQPQSFVDAKLRFISNERLSELFIQPSSAAPGQTPPKHELRIGTHSRSDKVHYKGPQSLTIFAVEKDPQNRELRRPVATTQLPACGNDLLIALVAYFGPDGTKRYHAQAYDDSVEAFPAGSMRILNMTPVSLQGRIGSTSLEIPTGVSLLPAIPSAATKHLGLAYILNDQVFPVSDQAYHAEPGERVLIALLPPFARGSGAIRARVIRDSGNLDASHSASRFAQNR
jgi:hypothetical protein